MLATREIARDRTKDRAKDRTMPRQLNIRSDEAYALAHAHAQATGKTVTEVVTEALKAMPRPKPAPVADIQVPKHLTPEQAKRYRMIMEWSARTAAAFGPNVSSDHEWLYDEKTGLPK
jgi:hypothetical protein